MYELMCTFFFSCHTYTLASDHQLEQPDWRKNRGQFSRKNLWLVVVANGGMWGTTKGQALLKVTLGFMGFNTIQILDTTYGKK